MKFILYCLCVRRVIFYVELMFFNGIDTCAYAPPVGKYIIFFTCFLSDLYVKPVLVQICASLLKIYLHSRLTDENMLHYPTVC